MTIIVESKQGLSLEEIRAFLKASNEIHFEGQNREEIHQWVNQTQRQQHDDELGRTGRGLVRSYIGKMTG